MPEPILDVRDLKVSFPTEDGVVRAVDGVSFVVMPGETLGVVGESGSGKSVTFLTVMGLVGSAQADVSGEILFRGQDLLKVTQEEMRELRGTEISMIFQDPLTSLHPLYRVGAQIAEAIRLHEKVSKDEAHVRAVDMLDRVRIPRPKERAQQYPHEFSGGMRQRAMIAMALALNPDLLIADEPTTALDVTVQAQILTLIDTLRSEFDTAIVLITHDLGVVAEHCNDIQVMYAGRLVEQGRTDDIYYRPHHPYTKGLLESVPAGAERGADLRSIGGKPPELHAIPPACVYQDRCPMVRDVCREQRPAVREVAPGHVSACHFAEEVAR